jgi:uncharacterized protein YndB with AHSA1/START domain
MTGRTDTASRRIDAPVDRVYGALTDPEARARWLPPTGMTARMERYDVVEATFVELVEGERVVEAIEFESDDPAFAGTMTMTWQLTPLADGTKVRIVASGVPTGISAPDHATGMQSSLENLATYVE